jgi:hypothetical protein
MQKIKFVFLSIFSIGLFISGKPDIEIGKKYSEDFNALVTSLKELHPRLYANISAEEFDSEVKKINERLLNTTSRSKAIYMMQELVYKIGNAHAGNLSVYSIRNDSSITKVLPFNVYILNHELYIKNYPADTSFNGTKILSIENTNSKALVDSLKIFFTLDGKRDVIDFYLQPFFNALYSFYSCQKDVYTVMTEKGKLIANAALRGTPLFETLMLKSDDAYFGNERVMKKEITSDYGYFKFTGFVSKYKQYTIESDFKSMIKELNEKKVPNLIIDLKYNEGGNPEMGARMISLISDKPFRIFEDMYQLKCRKPTYLKLMSGKPVYYKFRNLRTRKAGDMRQVVRMERDLKLTKPKGEPFKGNIYIVTGSVTKSAATMFCKYLIGQPNVTFVGAETSGAINYFWAGGPNGTYSEIKLSNLNTVFAFAIDLNELKAGSSKNEVPVGLIPDHKIDYTIDDLMKGRNKELEWIKSDIEKSTGK